MPRMRAVQYRVRYLLRGHVIDPMDLPAPFRLGRKRPVSITLSGDIRDEGPDKTWVNLCDAETVIAPRPDAFDELSALAERRPPPAAFAQASTYFRGLLDDNGHIRSGCELPIRFLSRDVQNLVSSAEHVL